MGKVDFLNLTEEENKLANSFFEKAEECFLMENQHKEFSKMFNLFNSLCRKREFDPSQYIMSFKEEQEALTLKEEEKLNEYRNYLISQREIKKLMK